jgi:MFS family permease
MMLATGLIDTAGRRRLIIVGFGGGSLALILLSAMANAIRSSKDEEDGDHDPTANDAVRRHRAAIAFALACSYTVSLCVCWLALDCASAESFPTRVRGTGRGVCVATGRVAGFCVQFLYGPLVNEDGLGRMMGLASAFAFGGMMLSSLTTDTTNVDLRDNWDYSSTTTTTTADDGVSLDRLGEFAGHVSATEEKQ